MFKKIGIIGVAWMLMSAVSALAQEQEFNDTLKFDLLTQPGDGVNAEPAVPGTYWLGTVCFPVQPALRIQLHLSEKEGLLVESVMPDSPAAKAGIVQYDILVRAGDKPLGDVPDLIKAVETAKEGKLKLELIRGGKPQTIEATPAKRPEGAFNPVPPDAADWGTVQKWLESMKQGAPGNGPQTFQFRTFGPGAIVSKAVPVPVQLPPNTSVSISKSNDQPTKIVVTRGNDKWEVTEKELDKLPADLRPAVEQMLGQSQLGRGAFGVVIGGNGGGNGMIFGGGNGGGSFSSGSGVFPPGGKFTMPVPPPGTIQVQPVPSPSMMNPQLEKRLDDMDRHLEKLLDIVEKMQEKQESSNK